MKEINTQNVKRQVHFWH